MKRYKKTIIAVVLAFLILLSMTLLNLGMRNFKKQSKSDVTVETLCTTYHLNLKDIGYGQISKVQGFMNRKYYEIRLGEFEPYYMILEINSKGKNWDDEIIEDQKTVQKDYGEVNLYRKNAASEGYEMFNYFHLENDNGVFNGMMVKPEDTDPDFNDQNYKEIIDILDHIFDDTESN